MLLEWILAAVAERGKCLHATPGFPRHCYCWAEGFPCCRCGWDTGGDKLTINAGWRSLDW